MEGDDNPVDAFELCFDALFERCYPLGLLEMDFVGKKPISVFQVKLWPWYETSSRLVDNLLLKCIRQIDDGMARKYGVAVTLLEDNGILIDLVPANL